MPFNDKHAESGLSSARDAYRSLPFWIPSVRAAPIQ